MAGNDQVEQLAIRLVNVLAASGEATPPSCLVGVSIGQNRAFATRVQDDVVNACLENQPLGGETGGEAFNIDPLHTLVDLASVSKVVGTTTAIMQLYVSNKINLDQPFQNYLHTNEIPIELQVLPNKRAPEQVVQRATSEHNKPLALQGSLGGLDLDQSLQNDRRECNKFLAIQEHANIDNEEVNRSFHNREAFSSTITVRHLLQHQAGLHPWQPLYLRKVDKSKGEVSYQENTREVFTQIAQLPIPHAPETGRRYSDIGFMYLGRIIENITQQPLDLAIQNLVVEPFNLPSLCYKPTANETDMHCLPSSHGNQIEKTMVQTNNPYVVDWAALGRKSSNIVTDFAWRTNMVVGEVNDANCHHAFNGIAGHAGLFATPQDLLSFTQAFANGAFSQSAKTFWQPHIDRSQVLGWQTVRLRWGDSNKPVRMYFHHGFTGVTAAFVPQIQLGIIMVTNRLLSHNPKPTDWYFGKLLKEIGLWYNNA